MKILLVNDYGTLEGGAERVTQLLRDGLRGRGHDARVLTSSAGGGNGTSFADDRCFGTLSRARTLLQTANPWAYCQLRRVLDGFRPDVVHVRMFLTQLSPLILPLLRRVPSLWHVGWLRGICPRGTKILPDATVCRSPWGVACYRHGCLPARDWPLLMTQMHLLDRWRAVFRRIVVNSNALQEAFAAEGIPAVDVVYNGVAARPARPPLSAPPTVGFAGRLVHQKGADLLLTAFQQVAAAMPDARLVVAGDGPQRQALEQQTACSGFSSRVQFVGHLAPAELERVLAPAWVQVVPSRAAEGFGNVAAEAMMRGTAVVASACGGLREVVRHHQTGRLVPPDDPAALADNLLELLRDRALAESLGQAGRAVALEQFSEATFVDRFLNLYQSIT